MRSGQWGQRSFAVLYDHSLHKSLIPWSRRFLPKDMRVLCALAYSFISPLNPIHYYSPDADIDDMLHP